MPGEDQRSVSASREVVPILSREREWFVLPSNNHMESVRLERIGAACKGAQAYDSKPLPRRPAPQQLGASSQSTGSRRTGAPRKDQRHSGRDTSRRQL